MGLEMIRVSDTEYRYEPELKFAKNGIYWKYFLNEDCWELERVYPNGNRILIETNLDISPHAMLERLCDREYRVPCAWANKKTKAVGPMIQLKEVKWSSELDGKSIMILLARYPKMSFGEIMMVIENEGGTVDAGGIIHKA